jgi:hypothetical protein
MFSSRIVGWTSRGVVASPMTTLTATSLVETSTGATMSLNSR